MLERQGGQVIDFVTRTLRDQIGASMNLHSGQLGNVQPRVNE
ncbi:MAG: hypothetical protein ABIJ34_09400 [archaeon]